MSGGAQSLSILHLSAARFDGDPWAHPTAAIWRRLAEGARRYTVVARNAEARDRTVQEGAITLHLLASRRPRELEFLRSQFRACALAAEAAPDVVISQNPALGGMAGARIARRFGIGHLTELHSSAFTDPAPALRDRALQALSAPVLRRATRIRALLPRMREEALARYGAALADRMVALPPRVELALFPPKDDFSTAKPLKVLMAGSLTARKGQLRAVEALAASPVPVELRLAGGGPDRAALADRATLLGALDHAALAREMRDADLFLMFSSQEGAPRAIMEAMASALPVLTTDAGYCADMLRDGEEGFILRGDPARTLRDRLAELAADPALRRRMGAAARARAERDYAAETLYPRYRALIAETAAEGRR